MSKKYILKSFDEASEKLNIDYKKELNPEQFKVVTDINGACLVLAGAGSGKTRTLVYRVAYMLEKGIKPERILLMTFTNKAAKEMNSRIELLLKKKPQGLWGGTFHHVGNRILRMYGKQIGINPDFQILDQEDAKDMVKSCLAELNIPKDKYFPKADAILRIISLGINTNKSVRDIVESRFSYLEESVIPRIEAAAGAYQEKKKQSNSLDYDDLLSKWNQLLLESAEIREKLVKKFQYILVDEYQDTNYIQGEIVKNLAGENPNVLAVGDDSQSIYSFRGATVSNILNFPKIFKQTKTFKLETNYRSTPEILNLANASIKHNLNQFEKNLNTSKASSDKPVLAAFYDSRKQADFICQRILELSQDEGVSLNDMAVLFRAHYQSLELEIALSKRSIPYEIRGGLRFFEQAHIKDVIAHLKAYNNFSDELAWTRILRLQEGIGPANAAKVWKKVSAAKDLAELSTADFGDLPPKIKKGFDGVVSILQKINQLAEGEISESIRLVYSSGYDKYLASSFDNASDRMDDLNQLIDYASSYDSLEKFLADVALSEGFKGQSILDYNDGPDEAVTLSTIHQAKGLEWKVVFILNLVDGQFPHAKVFDRPEELEEERRLFYVGSTRAKDKLYLTYPMMSTRGDVFTRVSQFVSEVPEDLYDKWDIEEEKSYDDFDDGEDDGEVRYVDEDTGGILDIYLRNS